MRHLTYGYDQLDRLSGVTETLGNAYAYSYDIGGNRTEEWLNGVRVQQAQYDPANELITLTTPQSGTTIQTYDQAGNLRQDNSNSYGYDALNELVALTATATGQQTTYTYNGDGVLSAQAVSGTTPTTYTQDLAAAQPPPAAPPYLLRGHPGPCSRPLAPLLREGDIGEKAAGIHRSNVRIPA